MRSQLANMSEGLPALDGLPTFSALLVDALGHLWIREYSRPRENRSVWTVYDSDARVLGFVETPPELDVFEIGEDYLLGVATDELDVEYVQMWRLTRIDE